MSSFLNVAAFGLFVFFVVFNWRLSIVLSILFGVLAYTIGFQTALLIFVGFGVLILFLEPGIALLLTSFTLGLGSLVGLRMAIVILFLLLVVLFTLLVLALSDGPGIRVGFRDSLALLSVGLSSGLSTFVNRIELIGTLPSPQLFFKSLFSRYPGLEFTRQFRETFVETMTEYAEDGEIEVEESQETLAHEVREAYDCAGQLLSNGEGNLALILVIISILPFLREMISQPVWMLPPKAFRAALSIAFRIAVRRR